MYISTNPPREDRTVMNQMNQMTRSIRFTNLHNTSASFGQSFIAGLDTEISPTNPNANQGADEFVIDFHNGTLASLQESPSLASVMNDNDRSCSFIL